MTCALVIARSEPIALASLPDIRARSSPGMAIAAMMPIIATPPNSATISVITTTAPWLPSRSTSCRCSAVRSAGAAPEKSSFTPGRVR